MTRSAQRVIGAVVLLVLGMVTLPLAAYVVDGDGAENWIIVIDLVAMALFGAAVTVALPALAHAGASRGRRVLTGIWWGLLAAFVGVAVFFLLLSGLRGA